MTTPYGLRIVWEFLDNAMISLLGKTRYLFIIAHPLRTDLKKRSADQHGNNTGTGVGSISKVDR